MQVSIAKSSSQMGLCMKVWIGWLMNPSTIALCPRFSIIYWAFLIFIFGMPLPLVLNACSCLPEISKGFWFYINIPASSEYPLVIVLYTSVDCTCICSNMLTLGSSKLKCFPNFSKLYLPSKYLCLIPCGVSYSEATVKLEDPSKGALAPWRTSSWT